MVRRRGGRVVENSIGDRIEEKYTRYLNCETDTLELTIEEAIFILETDESLHYVEDLLQEAYKVILSDYKRVLKENEEKNKIIDSMIKVMIDSSICDYFIKENCKNYAGENRKICDDCIKEYFENKVKEVK